MSQLLSPSNKNIPHWATPTDVRQALRSGSVHPMCVLMLMSLSLYYMPMQKHNCMLASLCRQAFITHAGWMCKDLNSLVTILIASFLEILQHVCRSLCDWWAYTAFPRNCQSPSMNFSTFFQGCSYSDTKEHDVSQGTDYSSLGAWWRTLDGWTSSGNNWPEYTQYHLNKQTSNWSKTKLLWTLFLLYSMLQTAEALGKVQSIHWECASH